MKPPSSVMTILQVERKLKSFCAVLAIILIVKAPVVDFRQTKHSNDA